jgi:hypothetical protein
MYKNGKDLIQLGPLDRANIYHWAAYTFYYHITHVEDIDASQNENTRDMLISVITSRRRGKGKCIICVLYNALYQKQLQCVDISARLADHSSSCFDEDHLFEFSDVSGFISV